MSVIFSEAAEGRQHQTANKVGKSSWSPQNFDYSTWAKSSLAQAQSGLSNAKLSVWFAFSLSLITTLVLVYCFQIPVIET